MKRDGGLLLDVLLAARDAQEFVREIDEEAFRASRLHQNAVIRSLEIIGEAAGNLSPEFRARCPGIPWNDIVGMRHRLIHNYGGCGSAWFGMLSRVISRCSSKRSNPWFLRLRGM